MITQDFWEIPKISTYFFLDDTVGKTKIHYFENAIYCCENALVTDCVLGNIAQKGGWKKVQFIDSKISIWKISGV